jgi:ribbon-helix-helix CopG family protein
VGDVRTTVNLDPDVVAAIQVLRDERKIGLSEAVNELIRQGLQVPQQRKEIEWETYPMGLKIDVTSISAALEELDGPDWR